MKVALNGRISIKDKGDAENQLLQLRRFNDSQPVWTIRREYADKTPNLFIPKKMYPNLEVAVRVGFEPTVPFRVRRFSRPFDSTTLAPHHPQLYRISGLG